MSAAERFLDVDPHEDLENESPVNGLQDAEDLTSDLPRTAGAQGARSSQRAKAVGRCSPPAPPPLLLVARRQPETARMSGRAPFQQFLKNSYHSAEGHKSFVPLPKQKR